MEVVKIRKMQRQFVFVCALAAGCLAAGAQDAKGIFNAAPPETEKALRERVAGFYQAFADQKYRQAEKYVCEDTQEMYYRQEKQKINSFELLRINWNDTFDKAQVTTVIGTTIQMRGQNLPANAPMATRWKLEEGQWCYYVDLTLGRESPFGPMKPGPANDASRPNVQQLINNPNIILNQVKVSKELVELKGYEPSKDQITISNGMPGEVSLEFRSESIAGLTWKLDKPNLKQNETATISFDYQPKDKSAKPTLNATIHIQPFGRVLPLKIVFGIPPEVQKLIPKQ
jgi:hypothetical protein